MRRVGFATWLGVLTLFLLLAIVIGVLYGPTPIPLMQVMAILFHPTQSINSIIIWQIRLPRVAASALVGGALAVSGAVMQALLKNPLADPYIVGASAGAGLGAILAQDFFPALGLVGPSAFIGSVAAVGLSYGLARGKGRVQMLTLILAGYAVGIILSAVGTFLMLLNRENLSTIFAWEIGGIHGMTWSHLWVPALLILLGSMAIWPFSPDMNAFLLGDEQAHHIGVAVERVQLFLLLAASLLTAAAVYLSGLIGFVGLVVPHVVRRLTGPQHRRLLPLAFLAGAVFLVIADTVAEHFPGIGTLPVGLITAFLGGPYFLYLLNRQNQRAVGGM